MTRKTDYHGYPIEDDTPKPDPTHDYHGQPLFGLGIPIDIVGCTEMTEFRGSTRTVTQIINSSPSPFTVGIDMGVGESWTPTTPPVFTLADLAEADRESRKILAGIRGQVFRSVARDEDRKIMAMGKPKPAGNPLVRPATNVPAWRPEYLHCRCSMEPVDEPIFDNGLAAWEAAASGKSLLEDVAPADYWKTLKAASMGTKQPEQPSHEVRVNHANHGDMIADIKAALKVAQKAYGVPEEVMGSYRQTNRATIESAADKWAEIVKPAQSKPLVHEIDGSIGLTTLRDLQAKHGADLSGKRIKCSRSDGKDIEAGTLQFEVSGTGQWVVRMDRELKQGWWRQLYPDATVLVTGDPAQSKTPVDWSAPKGKKLEPYPIGRTCSLNSLGQNVVGLLVEINGATPWHIVSAKTSDDHRTGTWRLVRKETGDQMWLADGNAIVTVVGDTQHPPPKTLVDAMTDHVAESATKTTVFPPGKTVALAHYDITWRVRNYSKDKPCIINTDTFLAECRQVLARTYPQTVSCCVDTVDVATDHFGLVQVTNATARPAIPAKPQGIVTVNAGPAGTLPTKSVLPMGYATSSTPVSIPPGQNTIARTQDGVLWHLTNRSNHTSYNGTVGWLAYIGRQEFDAATRKRPDVTWADVAGLRFDIDHKGTLTLLDYELKDPALAASKCGNCKPTKPDKIVCDGACGGCSIRNACAGEIKTKAQAPKEPPIPLACVCESPVSFEEGCGYCAALRAKRDAEAAKYRQD